MMMERVFPKALLLPDSGQIIFLACFRNFTKKFHWERRKIRKKRIRNHNLYNKGEEKFKIEIIIYREEKLLIFLKPL